MKIIVVIPARYGSSRFAGKVLAKETGKYLVQHTYERALCAKTVDQALIATDDEHVMAACAEFGGACVMTSAAHHNSSTTPVRYQNGSANGRCSSWAVPAIMSSITGCIDSTMRMLADMRSKLGRH